MKGRIARKLGEQLRFIERSSQAYDQGFEEEAMRIAVSLRVIFHDKGRSVSILSHLGIKDKCMLSSSRGHMNWEDYLSSVIDLSSSPPIRMAPILGSQFREVGINKWWDEECVFTYDNENFTRRRIILSLAERDGGAHVDEELESYYKVLCEGKYAFGITGNNLRIEGAELFEQGVTHYANNAHLALLRQFGHEVLTSAKHYSWPII